MTSRFLLAGAVGVLVASAAAAAAVLDTRLPAIASAHDAAVHVASAAPVQQATAQGTVPAEAPADLPATHPGDALDLDAMYDGIRRQVEQAVDTEAIEARIAEALEDVDVEGLVAGAMQSVEGMMPGTPRLGVGIRDLTAEEAKAAGLDGIRGAWVVDVRTDSPAAQAGLAAGDVVVRADGQDVRGARHLTRLVAETPAGRAIAIEYLRNGQREVATVTAAAGGPWTMAVPRGMRAPRQPRAFAFERTAPLFGPSPVARGRIGASVQDLTSQLATYFGVEHGVLVTSVTDGSPADRGGLEAGDVITRVGTADIESVRDLTRAIGETASGTEVEVQISRNRDVRTLSVMPDTPPTRQRTVIRSRSRARAD